MDRNGADVRAELLCNDGRSEHAAEDCDRRHWGGRRICGAHMAQAGEDVVFIDFWPENVETIRAKGLRISHIRDVPEFVVPVRALHLTEVQTLAQARRRSTSRSSASSRTTLRGRRR